MWLLENLKLRTWLVFVAPSWVGDPALFEDGREREGGAPFLTPTSGLPGLPHLLAWLTSRNFRSGKAL